MKRITILASAFIALLAWRVGEGVADLIGKGLVAQFGLLAPMIVSFVILVLLPVGGLLLSK